MADISQMPRYDVRNDGAGPYAAFYCDKCDHEYRSQPNVGGTIAQSATKNVAGNLLRRVPVFGGALASSVENQDPRYVTSLTPAQLQDAWKQVAPRFHLCPTCMQMCCPSCWDAQSNTCTDDSPRKAEIAEAEAEQAAGVVKGFASVFGLGAVVSQAAQAAQAGTAKCPKDGTMAPAGTKFCPECGAAMVQPQAAAAAAVKCPNCGADTKGAKFCPECGAKQEAAPATCKNCGAELKGAKFCPECGTKA
ncbi:MAG: zinc ribbon domain-containing protein [Chloroflexi bacterium]|nr:zinc ribbon domain-containing protein [Chloroflexota bacterium]